MPPDYRLEVSQEAGYLHAVVTGSNTRENVEAYLRDALRACVEMGCRHLLIEERLDGPRLGTADAYQAVLSAAKSAAEHLSSAAYVDVNMHDESNMRLAERVAVTRGVPVKMFPSVAAAKVWIAEQAKGDRR